MEDVAVTCSTEAILETLRTRGWCLGDLNQVKTLIVLFRALSDDVDSCSIAGKVESELINMDLRSITGISLTESNLRKSSLILGPKVLQISSVRDISKSSITEFSGNSSAIPDNVVPGTKIRLENKVMIKGGILCLNPKVVTVLGGVVQSLYDEWEMNKKYSGFSRSSHESGTGGPPPFEKLQIEAPSSSRFAQPGISHNYSESTSKRAGPTVASSVGNTESRRSRKNQNVEVNVDNGLKTASVAEKMEENPSSSETRPKEVIESVPLQNQAAAQKLLQKMGHSRGRKHRGKGKQEEPVVFTLDEWEKRKGGTKPQTINEYPETSRDEDLARQLQAQLDMEDYHFSVFLATKLFQLPFAHRHRCMIPRQRTLKEVCLAMEEKTVDISRNAEVEEGGEGGGEEDWRGRGRGRF
ncbi:hypothetical protein like AT5G19950 [Hibiscus trionum]|uniref:RecQ mediated genome instability protein 1 OB-fold domain-containing protein n=1 Tax=Hibiscus trionum TaxID=183268 RepID=A0A9W7MDL9_HIBTR|nr:hypothetical protein like AT5G19950 [Hibiscus trionum]